MTEGPSRTSNGINSSEGVVTQPFRPIRAEPDRTVRSYPVILVWHLTCWSRARLTRIVLLSEQS
jgi:hypothetical protein